VASPIGGSLWRTILMNAHARLLKGSDPAVATESKMGAGTSLHVPADPKQSTTYDTSFDSSATIPGALSKNIDCPTASRPRRIVVP
jgi:hypothetical protein